MKHFTPRSTARLAMAGTCLMLCSYASAGTTSYNSHSSFALYRGYDLKRAQAMYRNPFVLGSVKVARITAGSPVTVFKLKQGSDAMTTADGSSFDLKLEGRYAAYSGGLSVSGQAYEKLNRNDFVFSMTYDRDFGNYIVTESQLTDVAKLVRQQGRALWEQYYGSHVILGDRRHSFVHAFYKVQSLSKQTIRSLNMSVNASGKWVIGGFGAASDYRQLLETLSSSSQVEVEVTTNVPNSNFTRTIRNAADVDAVLEDLAELATQMNSSTTSPVSYQFDATPWEEYLDSFPGPTTALDQDLPYQNMMEEWFRNVGYEARLKEIYSGRLNYFSYMGTPLLNYYAAQLNVVRNRQLYILNKLKEWRTTGSAPLFWTPLQISWPVPFEQKVVWNFPHTFFHGEWKIYGGSNFAFARIKNRTTGATYPGQVWNYARFPAQADYADITIGGSSASLYFDSRDRGHAIFVEILNQNGDIVHEFPIEKAV